MMLPAIYGASETNLSADPSIHHHSYEPVKPSHGPNLGTIVTPHRAFCGNSTTAVRGHRSTDTARV
jgi:hypothetical protein